MFEFPNYSIKPESERLDANGIILGSEIKKGNCTFVILKSKYNNIYCLRQKDGRFNKYYKLKELLNLIKRQDKQKATE